MIKHTTKMFALLFIFASIVLFISCQEQQSVVTPDAGQSLSKETILTLDPGVTVVSAKLVLFQNLGNNQLNQIHRVTAPWMENTVTWNNFAGAYDPAVSGSFLPAPGKNEDTLHIDVTALVQGWASCSYDNNGLLIDQVNTDPSLLRSLYYSKENTNPTLGERAPYLIVDLSNGTTVEVTTIADAYIWEKPENVNSNYGSSEFLNDGYLDGYEKQILVKFDIQCTPPSGGCTYTIGYWKTHSQSGPAPYDNTWALLPGGMEENTVFFLSGQTWYQVFNTAPAGNPYYQVAHQYMGAQLNFLHEADPSAIQSAFDAATSLFNTYTPAQVAAMPNNSLVKKQFKALIQPLTDYNEGTIGPGHCD